MKIEAKEWPLSERLEAQGDPELSMPATGDYMRRAMQHIAWLEQRERERTAQ